jgi:hypothetical protein
MAAQTAAPIDRPRAKKNEAKQLIGYLLATKGLFLFHHVVSGHRPYCGKPIPLRVYDLHSKRGFS